jgi:phage anti-repressor protein
VKLNPIKYEFYQGKSVEKKKIKLNLDFAKKTAMYQKQDNLLQR